MSDTPEICLLHIGKTGGSYLRSVLRHNRAKWTQPLQLLRHSATLESTLDTFGEDRRLAFTFRNPTDRFVSAFYSRQRQGRPTYQFDWSAEEAAAFLWFETAEDLALALASPDARRKSAAIFAMGAIEHLNSNLATYLHSVDALKMSKGAIIACVDLPDLDDKLPEFLAKIGVENAAIPNDPKRHASPTPLPKLSPEAERALRSFWQEEYEIYNMCKRIALSLDLSG